MAQILTTLGWLTLGIAIGWWIKRNFFAPVFDESDMARLSCEWGQNLAEHAEAQKASVVWTAPEAYVPLPDGRSVPVAVRREP